MTPTIPREQLLRVASLNLLNSTLRLDERYALLQQELMRAKPDVLCLQEVIVEQRERLTDVLRQVGFTAGEFGGTVTANAVLGSFTSTSGCAVFTRSKEAEFVEFDFKKSFSTLMVPTPSAIPTVAARLNLGSDGGVVHVLSSHFAWGMQNEAVRLRQATAVNDYAEQAKVDDPEAVVILGGDLNAIPDSSTLRYLHGLQADHRDQSTHWVDAWTHLGSAESEFTSMPSTNQWSRSMAMKVARTTLPDLVPNRRIDYLLSHGWTYGRRGGPVRFNKFAHHTIRGLEISDHAGVIADFLL